MKCGRKYLAGRALPTVEARERIGEQRRTAKGRADMGSNIRPVADPEAIEALLAAAREEGTDVAAFVIALLDVGVRRGEALALRWRWVAWGSDEDDKRRHLLIAESLSRNRGIRPDRRNRAERDGLAFRAVCALPWPSCGPRSGPTRSMLVCSRTSTRRVSA